MNSNLSNQPVWKSIANEYGIVFVLLLLIAILSLLTLEQQNPTGTEAGRQVANQVIKQYGADVNVIVIAETTPVDDSFVREVSAVLQSAGANVATTVKGKPADARRAIEALVVDGRSIDAVAATADTVEWTIYDRFETVGQSRCVGPRSYTWPTFAKLDNLLSVAN